jgi:hypothetical protein
MLTIFSAFAAVGEHELTILYVYVAPLRAWVDHLGGGMINGLTTVVHLFPLRGLYVLTTLLHLLPLGGHGLTTFSACICRPWGGHGFHGLIPFCICRPWGGHGFHGLIPFCRPWEGMGSMG